MQKLIDWYWTHGVERKGEYSIGVSTWLDTITQMKNRVDAIRSHSGDGRACLAVWGPSQTGKSTMIADAIDGADSGNGAESALSWEGGELARFTGDPALYPETVFFNPYNGGSDGSGVPTRYVLRSASDMVDAKHPAEIVLASRAQVMLGLTIGYSEECTTSRSGRTTHYSYDVDSFKQELREAASKASPGKVNRKAVELLQDAADVIAIAALTQRRFEELAPSWGDLRAEMLSKKSLLSDADAALSFVTHLLWDNATSLSDMFERLDRKLSFLRKAWGDRRIYASLRAANLLLNIDTISSYKLGSKLVVPSVDSLGYVVEESRVVIDTLGESSKPICGNEFGLFQALVNELVVPLRREALEQHGKTQFLSLMEKADYLDFPGVPNRETGSSAADKVNACDVNDVTLLKTVLKQGKTLSMIFIHARQMGIDSFVILKRFNKYAPKTAVLSQGIQSWRKSFSDGNDAGDPLRFYMNLTFFAEEASTFYGNASPDRIKNYAEMVSSMGFITPKDARFFATTYPVFGGVHAFPQDNPEKTMLIQEMFSEDKSMKEATGLTLLDYEHVFHDSDGGVGYLFETIGSELSSNERLSRCKRLLESDLSRVRKLIQSELPPVDQVDPTTFILGVKKRIEERLSKVADVRQVSAVVSEISRCLKQLMVVPADSLDALKGSSDIEEYISRQLGIWCSYQTSELAKNPLSDELFVDTKQLLKLLKDRCDVGELSRFASGLDLDPDSNLQAQNRKYLSLALSNSLFYGSYKRVADSSVSVSEMLSRMTDRDGQSRDYEKLPDYHMVIRPFLKCLESMASDIKASVRPEQAGDVELSALLEEY